MIIVCISLFDVFLSQIAFITNPEALAIQNTDSFNL